MSAYRPTDPHTLVFTLSDFQPPYLADQGGYPLSQRGTNNYHRSRCITLVRLVEFWFCKSYINYAYELSGNQIGAHWITTQVIGIIWWLVPTFSTSKFDYNYPIFPNIYHFVALFSFVLIFLGITMTIADWIDAWLTLNFEVC